MTSSFKKAVKSKPSDNDGNNTSSGENSEKKVHGYKSWSVGSSGIISTGHREYDIILGGGHVLGTFLLILNDSYTDYAMTIMRYAISEGVAMKHRVILVDADLTACHCQTHIHASSSPSNHLDAIIHSLPYNMTGAHAQEKPAIEAEQGVESSTSASDQGLKIAWQYGKYLPAKESSSIARDKELASTYCCSYDLSKRLQPELLDGNRPIIINQASSLQALEEKLRQHLSANNNSQDITRIFIPHLDRFFYATDQNVISSRDVCRFLLAVKHMIRDYRVTLTCSIHRPSTPQAQVAMQCIQLADSAIAIDSFAGRMDAIPHEFREFVGFLSIFKLQQLGSLTAHHPAYDKYGLKRNRRKLCIEPLHLPPEESRAFGSAGTDEHFQMKAAAQQHQQQHQQHQQQRSEHHIVASESNQRVELKIESSAPRPSTPSATAVTASTSAAVDDSTKKKSLADSFAAARAARQAMKTTSTPTPPLAPGSSCMRNNLDF